MDRFARWRTCAAGELPGVDRELARVLESARRLASETGSVVCIDHALVAACSLPLVREAIREEDGDAAEWALALRNDLRRCPPPSTPPGNSLPEWGTVLLAMLGRDHDPPFENSVAMLLGFAFGPPSTRVPVAMRREYQRLEWSHAESKSESVPYRGCDQRTFAHPDEVLRRAGVQPVDVFAHIVHGEPCAVVRGPEAPAATWIFNDDFTTQDFVARNLFDLYGFSEARAWSITDEVHRLGAAEIARGWGAELQERAQELVDRARQLGFPLLVEVIEDE